MKRRIKSLRDKFNRWLKKQTLSEKVALIIALIIGIFLSFNLYKIIDKIPATENDYSKLKEKAIEIENNPETIYDTVCVMKIEENCIIIKLENNECKIIAEYDKSFKLLSTEKEDKAINKLELFFALISTFIVSVTII